VPLAFSLLSVRSSVEEAGIRLSPSKITGRRCAPGRKPFWRGSLRRLHTRPYRSLTQRRTFLVSGAVNARPLVLHAELLKMLGLVPTYCTGSKKLVK